ncbi:MAG: hypothetical protein IJ599_00670 [Alphaproteobacteria bacterium]|nr:hypothetical protein [Alphaproteobacteria bacterium]
MQKTAEIIHNDYKPIDTIPWRISDHLLPFQYCKTLEHFADKIKELAFFYGGEFIVEILDYPNNDVAKALKNMKEYFDNKLNCGKHKFYDAHDFIRMFFHPSITRIDGRLRVIDIIKKERVCLYTNVYNEKWIAMRELGRRDRGELIFEEASDQNNLKMDKQHTEIWDNGKLLGYIKIKGA